MGPSPTAKELLEEMIRLFRQTDFAAVRDALTGRLDPAEADELLGDFSRFLRQAVDPDVTIDLRATDTSILGPDYSRVFEGWRGWLEFWRLWTEPWSQERSTIEIEELDENSVLQHTTNVNTGRGSGIEVEWEAWNLWHAREGRIVSLTGYATRQAALEGAGRAIAD